MDKLTEARNKIDSIDHKLAELFSERMRAVEMVAEAKRKSGMPIYDKTRENEILQKRSELVNDLVLRGYFIEFLERTMAISRKYQYRILSGMKVAYCGVEGAFAHEAASRIFPYAETVPYADFLSAYNSVLKGESDCAVLPIENSFVGDVNTVMDLAFEGSLFINGVYDLEVVHNLLILPDANKDDILTVSSHMQALSQCKTYIDNNGFSTESASNTAAAAKALSLSGDKTRAVIASAKTAELYGLKIVDRRINDSSSNTTRFAVFSRTANAPSEKNNQFSLFFTVKNDAGALGKAVSAIGRHGFNLRNLKSHPTKKHNWQYYFFVEGSGNIHASEGQKMLEELRENCEDVKVIGVYKDECVLEEGASV